MVPTPDALHGQSSDFPVGPVISREQIDFTSTIQIERFTQNIFEIKCPVFIPELREPLYAGYSHFIIGWYFPKCNQYGDNTISVVPGDYRYKIKLRDKTNAGWDLSVEFELY